MPLRRRRSLNGTRRGAGGLEGSATMHLLQAERPATQGLETPRITIGKKKKNGRLVTQCVWLQSSLWFLSLSPSVAPSLRFSIISRYTQETRKEKSEPTLPRLYISLYKTTPPHPPPNNPYPQPTNQPITPPPATGSQTGPHAPPPPAQSAPTPAPPPTTRRGPPAPPPRRGWPRTPGK